MSHTSCSADYSDRTTSGVLRQCRGVMSFTEFSSAHDQFLSVPTVLKILRARLAARKATRDGDFCPAACFVMSK